MASTSYITISITTLVVAIAMIAGFKGCTAQKAAEISGICFAQIHKDFRYSYSFYLRESEGTILFDADLRTATSPYCITLESVVVDTSHLNKFKEFTRKYKLTEYVQSCKISIPVCSHADTPKNTVTLFFTDGTEKSAFTKEEHINLLYNYFFDLAKAYTPPSAYGI